MGLLSLVGKAIIILTVLFFFGSLYISFILLSLFTAVVGFFGLVIGAYVGYLGIKVDDDEESHYPSHSETSDLEKRVRKLEELLRVQLADADTKAKEKVTLYVERDCPFCGTLITMKRAEAIVEPHFCPNCHKKIPIGYFDIPKKLSD
ncbi:MAG: hypothetical protein OK439_07370 [Thaumarchaeota archaeon]|nr:hypothetical protein [Nitrososphaerota archaeon]